MKKLIFFGSFLISLFVYAQADTYKGLPYQIGDYLNFSYTIDPIPIKSKFFRSAEYSTTSEDTVYQTILNFKKFKHLLEVRKQLDSNPNLEIVSELDWGIRVVKCYIDRKYDLEYILDFSFGENNSSLSIKSFKIKDSPFFKDEDKYKKQVRFINTRFSYLEVGLKKIRLNFRFNIDSPLIYGVLEFRYDDWEFHEKTYILLDGTDVMEKDLVKIDREVLRNGNIKEISYFALSVQEAQKIISASKIEFKLDGSKGSTEFTMTYPQKMSIKDILSTDLFNPLTSN